MSFFTVGNLLTLGIFAVVLILLRYLDRHNRSVDLAREFGKRLKEELAQYVAEREAAVKDYALELDVQQKAARELLKRLQLTDEEFSDKTVAMTKIDERISAYDASLEELARMTERVDENLKRIEEESGFVETVLKRVSGAKDKLDTLEKDLSDVERRFKQENAISLEQAAESMIASVRSTVSDLAAQAETIERKVEDHREAVDRAEKTREENLSRDEERIRQTFDGALERAASRADKLEDSAMVKLRDQALERVHHYQATVEEKLKIYQENTKNKAAEMQGLIKTYKDDWKKDVLELNDLARGQKETWKQELFEIKELAKTQQEAWKQDAAQGEATARQYLASLEAIAAETKEAVTAETVALEDRLTELRNHAGGEISRIETNLADDTGGLEKQMEELRDRAAAVAAHITGDLRRIMGEAEEQAAAMAEENLEKWRQVAETADAKVRDSLANLETASVRQAEEIAAKTDALENLQAQFDRLITQNEHRISAETGRLENRLEELRKTFEEIIVRGEERITTEEGLQDERIGKIREYVTESAAGIELDIMRMMGETKEKAAAMAEENLEKWRQVAETADAKVQDSLANLETASIRQTEAIAAKTDILENLQSQFDRLIAQNEQRISAETGQLEDRLEELRKAFEEVIARGENRITAEEGLQDNRIGKLREYAVESAAGIERDMARMMEETREKAAVMAEENLEQWRQIAGTADAKARDTRAALEALSVEQTKIIAEETAAMDKRLTDLRSHLDNMFSQLESHIALSAEEAQEKALEAADHKLEEYRAAQLLQYRQLESLADDTARLDTELRNYMGETEDRVRQDFALYERESAQHRADVAADFTMAAQALKEQMDEAEKGLAALKSQAYENVSEKLQVFEDEFFQDLSKRSGDIDHRLEEWRTDMETKLGYLADETATERRNVEMNFAEQLKHRLQEQHDRFVADLEHLKAETGAFEEGIREQMDQADQSLTAFKEQLNQDLKEARSAAEVSAKAEIGRYGLSMADTLKQHQRELEGSFKELSDWVDERNKEITERLEASRRETEEWQYRFSAQLRDADNTIEDARRRARELAAESDERLSAIRSSIEEIHEEAVLHRTELFTQSDEQARNLDGAIREAERHLKEFISQTKLFDRADELKTELEHRIEDLEADMDSLDQRRSEAAELEAQFIKIKRLEDDISSRMTRFLSEKRRIELMEADFGRILQTSQAVEEKLAQISTSDDTLQAIQIRIRQLSDAMADAEEKYQRIEKKNQTLETTNQGIDRNFKALQETEATVQRFSDDLDHFSGELDSLRASIETLKQENEQAAKTSEKFSALDLSLTDLEKRIDAMQVAREWLARTETRLDELNRQTQEQLKLMGSLLKEEQGKGRPKEKGAPPLAIRENVIRLHRQGWSVDEIARSLKLSKGEVELIIEMGAAE